ncbi:hypothetical protein TTHERM_00554440 (macronuclear) [Tetrahymena thermophila SB210]|uniref:Transmembrane protein n=1 Tax=Tetrahymena thermophila (strain SB210) TaxID=312017 RepID=Q22UI1_TETTS|nr:hypothetical protein TTHERM_00554440 [Tetrahymena thermophila SB210]EAR88989.2 hypothetical protein TTHERM_00554440 [Tetrahymena thermophila SB210]|eukprot:XP_001009234.2 hypothetical protein TTHERM_00554440 [Tetrahymena thermophila SB210]
MNSLLIVTLTFLFGTALSQATPQSLGFSCANHFSANNCLNPCIFTPDPNSFVCVSSCMSLTTPQDCAKQPTCTFTTGFCELVANTCSNIQGPTITQDQCQAQNSACKYTPFQPATCAVLDDVKKSCSNNSDYYSCVKDPNCQFVDTEQKCSFQSKPGTCGDPKNCDPKYCNLPKCVTAGLQCDATLPQDKCIGNCIFKGGKCIDPCNDVCDKSKCQQGVDCSVNTDIATATCSTNKTDNDCVNNSNCLVQSKGTCQAKDNLCLDVTNCSQTPKVCKYTPPVNPICSNPVCNSQNYQTCDPGCQSVAPQCTPNGLSLCQSKSNPQDCANSTFCQFTQGGICATAVASSKEIIEFIVYSLILCLFL